MPSFPFTVPAGVTLFPSATSSYQIADNVSVIKYALGTWTQATRTVQLQFFVSVNGGPFEDAGGQNPVGGGATRSIGRDGTMDASAIFALPPGINRQGRVRATVVGGAVTSTINVTAV